MRGEGGVLVRGKFFGIGSGHMPPQRQRHELFELPGSAGRGRRDVGMAAGGRRGRERATQVEEARSLYQQLLDECEREKQAKRARRKEMVRKILLCGCPWDNDFVGNEVGITSGSIG